MKKVKNEKRVINISKEDFDTIKEYCEKNSLDMVSWMTKSSLEKIPKKIPERKITAQEASEMYEDASKLQLPDDWLDVVLKDIDGSVKDTISGSDMFLGGKYVYWYGYVSVNNKYVGSSWSSPFKNRRVPLSEEQIKLVGDDLAKLGFTMTKEESGWTKNGKYKISW